MEYLYIKDKEVSEKFKQWWIVSRKGNIPIFHPLDLDRFAELVKISFDKQDVFNVTMLHDFLYEQLNKGNIKKSEEPHISYVLSLYEFSVNNLVKLFVNKDERTI